MSNCYSCKPQLSPVDDDIELWSAHSELRGMLQGGGPLTTVLQWLQASPWACSFANMYASASIYSYSLYHLYLTVSLSLCLRPSLSLCPSLYLPLYLSIYLSVCLSVLSICLPVVSICLSIHPSTIYVPIITHLSILHTSACVTSTDSLLYI